MAPISVIPASQLDSTFGCLFLSAVFTSVLWGVRCLQLWIYYEKYWKTDKHWFKAYILLIWAFDTAHQVDLVYTVYFYFVKGIAGPMLPAQNPKTFAYTAILIAIIDALVQSVFIRRICQQQECRFDECPMRPRYWPICIYGSIFRSRVQLQAASSAYHTALAINSIFVVTDTFLAIALIYFLWKGRSGVRRTDTLVHRLIAYTVGTGLVTCLRTIAALVGAKVAPNSFFYILMDLTVPKLYFNCMLASMNARSSLRETFQSKTGALSIHLDTLPSSEEGRSKTSSGTSTKVLVTQATEQGRNARMG